MYTSAVTRKARLVGTYSVDEFDEEKLLESPSLGQGTHVLVRDMYVPFPSLKFLVKVPSLPNLQLMEAYQQKMNWRKLICNQQIRLHAKNK